MFWIARRRPGVLTQYPQPRNGRIRISTRRFWALPSAVASVAQYLVSRNVLADRLYVDGRGETQPVATNATAEGKAQNRRVEILIRPFRG